MDSLDPDTGESNPGGGFFTEDPEEIELLEDDAEEDADLNPGGVFVVLEEEAGGGLEEEEEEEFLDLSAAT